MFIALDTFAIGKWQPSKIGLVINFVATNHPFSIAQKNKSNYELNINFLIQKPFVKVIVKDERFNVKQERKNCQNNILIQLQQNYAFACDVRL